MLINYCILIILCTKGTLKASDVCRFLIEIFLRINFPGLKYLRYIFNNSVLQNSTYGTLSWGTNEDNEKITLFGLLYYVLFLEQSVFKQVQNLLLAQIP